MRRSSPSFLLASTTGPTRRTVFSVRLTRWHRRPQHTGGGSRSPTTAEASARFTTPLPDPSGLKLPFRFETGFALFAKRAPRPFPPPFLSPPSGSFSDPLSTHHQSRDKRAFVDGEVIEGWTNGDDAVYASDYFICANDGVGAWSARPRGHAGYLSHSCLSLRRSLSLTQVTGYGQG